MVLVNVGHPSGSHDLEEAIGRTMADVFPSVLRDPIESSNVIVLGTDSPASAQRLRDAIPDIPRELRTLAELESRITGPRLPGGDVYTDDRAPVEWLVDRSILGYAADE
jgi:hypothetical protein